jgi:hypothetical protein
VRISITQARIGHKNAIAAKESANVARDVFVAANRPRLAVRFMQLPETIISGMSLSGTFMVFNAGDTTAIVTQIYSEIVISEHLPARVYEGKPGVAVDRTELSSGQSTIIAFPSNGPLDLSDFGRWAAIQNRREATKLHARNISGPGMPNLFVVREEVVFSTETHSTNAVSAIKVFYPATCPSLMILGNSL